MSKFKLLYCLEGDMYMNQEVFFSPARRLEHHGILDP